MLASNLIVGIKHMNTVIGFFKVKGISCFVKKIDLMMKLLMILN